MGKPFYEMFKFHLDPKQIAEWNTKSKPSLKAIPGVSFAPNSQNVRFGCSTAGAHGAEAPPAVLCPEACQS